MKNWLRAMLVPVCLLAAGCATPGFNRMWETGTTDKGARAKDARGIAGPWVGTWESQKNGHTGDLRCLVEPLEGGRYLFRYWAEWGKGMKGSFKIVCDVKGSGGGYAVTGTKNLGLFGTYHHEGRITPRQFEASFRSDRKNLGTFRMKRPEGWKP